MNVQKNRQALLVAVLVLTLLWLTRVLGLQIWG